MAAKQEICVVLGPGIRYTPLCLGYKVPGKYHSFECGTSAVTKDGAFVNVEGLIQYRVTAREGFDLVRASIERLGRELWPTRICLKVAEMDYASVCENKADIGKPVEDYLGKFAGAWGIEACRVIISNIERYDPTKDEHKLFEMFEKYFSH